MNSLDDLTKQVGKNSVDVDHLGKVAPSLSPQSNQRSPKLPDIEITPEYQQILHWLNEKIPILFVTGKAGTGKTTLIQYLRENFEGSTVVVAPTGVAALNIQGVTIHSFFRFPPRIVTDSDIKLIRDKSVYRALKLLIIDEISMVRVEMIDAIDKFLQVNRDSSEPFGGVQLLMVGDLFQLPPVLQRPEVEALKAMGYKSAYFFGAQVFNRCEMVSKELSKVYRQNDEQFISTLNKVRLAENLDIVLPIINQRHLPPKSESETLITLTSTNLVANGINDLELSKLSSPMHTFKGVVSGKFTLGEEKLPSPINLSLKVGAQVMFTKNDDRKRWVNGTVGRVVKLNERSIRVEVSGGNRQSTFDVDQSIWESYKYEFNDEQNRVIPVATGFYLQYPLMLAWAVTIHKSQGRTLDQVCLNLGSGAFDYGQVYVALSRCRTLKDIYLSKPLRISDIMCDPVIKQFYDSLKAK